MPNLPEVDRAAAARRAIAARTERAEAKKRLSAGDVRPLELLSLARSGASEAIARMRVPDFLRAVPGIGDTKTTRILEELGIAPVKRLGGLGVRQLEALKTYLRSWEAAHPVARGRLLVLAGPTAVGKGTVASYIREHFPDVQLSVSATTRAPRPGEVDGTHYYFLSDAQFDELVAHDELLEWATVHNAYRYGTPKQPVVAALEAGRNVLLEIDIQGARSVRRAMPDAHLVFLLPPSWDELVRRLTGRATESAEEQERRLATAKVELAAVDEFDSQIVN
ncbi:MAG TPA: guanylate kinase, partial [Microbacteriaceae bacterium]|nr:guanylate kinase [Microbacteriaceae bacterium]